MGIELTMGGQRIDVEVGDATIHDLVPFLRDGVTAAQLVEIVVGVASPAAAPRARPARPAKSSSAGPVAPQVAAYLAKHPTVTFGPQEVARDLGLDDLAVRHALAALKKRGTAINPERGKYQHAAPRS